MPKTLVGQQSTFPWLPCSLHSYVLPYAHHGHPALTRSPRGRRCDHALKHLSSKLLFSDTMTRGRRTPYETDPSDLCPTLWYLQGHLTPPFPPSHLMGKTGWRVDRKITKVGSTQKITTQASLVAQWLRICLPMQGTRVRALVWEDPTCRGATKPVRHNY